MASAVSFPRFLAPIPTPSSPNLRRPSIPPIHLLPAPFSLRQKLPLLRRRSSAQENNDGAAEAVAGKKEEVEANGKEKSAAVMAKRKDRSMVEGFAEGFAEEVGEIEWPEFGKVVGITGVVLAVIAGSSVALLTVNAILAELSDRVFPGKGLQDFFTGGKSEKLRKASSEKSGSRRTCGRLVEGGKSAKPRKASSENPGSEKSGKASSKVRLPEKSKAAAAKAWKLEKSKAATSRA